jgi:hypothetical protein
VRICGSAEPSPVRYAPTADQRGELPRAWEAGPGWSSSAAGAAHRPRRPTAVDRERPSRTDATGHVEGTAGEDERGSGVAAMVTCSPGG